MLPFIIRNSIIIHILLTLTRLWRLDTNACLHEACSDHLAKALTSGCQRWGLAQGTVGNKGSSELLLGKGSRWSWGVEGQRR